MTWVTYMDNSFPSYVISFSLPLHTTKVDPIKPWQEVQENTFFWLNWSFCCWCNRCKEFCFLCLWNLPRIHHYITSSVTKPLKNVISFHKCERIPKARKWLGNTMTPWALQWGPRSFMGNSLFEWHQPCRLGRAPPTWTSQIWAFVLTPLLSLSTKSIRVFKMDMRKIEWKEEV